MGERGHSLTCLLPQVGMTIYARVKSVNMEKYSVDMTCRSSDLADKEGRFRSVEQLLSLFNNMAATENIWNRGMGTANQFQLN